MKDKPMLTFTGKLDAKQVKAFKGTETAKLQFVERGADGSIEFVEIKLPDNADHSQYVQGKEVTIPVHVTANNGKVYYKAAAE